MQSPRNKGLPRRKPGLSHPTGLASPTITTTTTSKKKQKDTSSTPPARRVSHRQIPEIPETLKREIPDVQQLLQDWITVLPTRKLPTVAGRKRTIERLDGYLGEHGPEKVRRLIVRAADRSWTGMEMEWLDNDDGRVAWASKNGGGAGTPPSSQPQQVQHSRDLSPEEHEQIYGGGDDEPGVDPQDVIEEAIKDATQREAQEGEP